LVTDVSEQLKSQLQGKAGQLDSRLSDPWRWDPCCAATSVKSYQPTDLYQPTCAQHRRWVATLTSPQLKQAVSHTIAWCQVAY